MKIKRIEIKNFRGIDSLTLNFLDPWDNILDLVVLAGPNGCGKTSVLEACLIAFNRHDLLSIRAKQTTAQDIRLNSDGYEIKLILDIEGVETDLLSATNISHSLKMEMDAITTRIERARPVEHFSSWRGPREFGSIPNISEVTSMTEENRLKVVKEELIRLTASKAFVSESENVSRLEKNEKAVFSKINKAWELFYPEKKVNFVPKLLDDKIERGFDLFLEDSELKQQIPIDALSSGEIEIFTMLGRFAIEDFSKGIIFIDEPELHLHPAWHRIVLRAIKTVLPETQIICATHSSEILDSVYSYERFTLLPEDDPRIRMVKSADSEHR